MTSWEPIEEEALGLIKNDTLLEYERRCRPALFYHRMAGYMRLALPRFSIPPETVLKLRRCTEPDYTDALFRPAQDEPAPVVLATGELHWDVVSAGIVSTDEFGAPDYTPLPAEYDPETGTLTVGEDLPAGAEVELDFYRRGSFEADLSLEERGILAYCIYTVWEHRLDNDAIERMMKLRDGGFSAISEANLTNAGTARLREADLRLHDMLRRYADNLEYLRVVKGCE